jgi:hypothetical protein
MSQGFDFYAQGILDSWQAVRSRQGQKSDQNNSVICSSAATDNERVDHKGKFKKGSTTATPNGLKCRIFRERIIKPCCSAVEATMMSASPGAWPRLRARSDIAAAIRAVIRWIVVENNRQQRHDRKGRRGRKTQQFGCGRRGYDAGPIMLRNASGVGSHHVAPASRLRKAASPASDTSTHLGSMGASGT